MKNSMHDTTYIHKPINDKVKENCQLSMAASCKSQ